MYFPKQDEVFGSYYFYKQVKKDDGKRHFQNYRVERTRWKKLRTENHICDEDNSSDNTTMCITRFIEQKVGCSMGWHGGDPDMKRCR